MKTIAILKNKRTMILTLIILLIIPASLFATADSEYTLQIIGMSKDLKYIALKVAGSNAVGPSESMVVKDLKTDKVIKKFKIIDPMKFPHSGVKALRQRAMRYIKEKGISKNYFNENFKRLKKVSANKFLIPGKGYLALGTQLYGDKIAIIFNDTANNDYKLLFKRDHQLRQLRKYCDRSGGFKNDMLSFDITNYFISVYMNKNNNDSILAIRHHHYSWHGYQGNEVLMQLDLNKEINDYQYLNIFGFRLYQKKLYRKAIEKFRASIKAKPNHTVALYNLACTYSLTGDSSHAVKYLKNLHSLWKNKNNKSAHRYLRKIKRDKDFNSIRDSNDFKSFLKLYSK